LVADEALRRGLQAAVRELFLYEREMGAAADKQDFWVSGGLGGTLLLTCHEDWI
jgi:hypothetical protein